MSVEMHLEAVRNGTILDDGQFVLIVGEDNPRSVAPQFALYNLPTGCAGHRLCSKVMRVKPHVYLSMWRTNLCNPKWSNKTAKVRATILGREGTPWRRVVLLGRKVATAFGRPTVDFFDVWDGPGDKRYTVLPHPSGRCRTWNEKDSYDDALTALRELAPSVPWGQL